MTPEQLEMIILEAIGKELRSDSYLCDWHAVWKECLNNAQMTQEDFPALWALYEGALHFRGWLKSGHEVSLIGGRFIVIMLDDAWVWEVAIWDAAGDMVQLERCATEQEIPEMLHKVLAWIKEGKSRPSFF